MGPKLVSLTMLTVVSSVSLGAIAQNDPQSPATGSGRNNAYARTSASPANAAPTRAQLDQPGAVTVAPPIERVSGTTVNSPDKPLFGKLDLPRGLALEGSTGNPPALPPTQNVAATNGTSNGRGAERPPISR
jgi:hypothetical protein